jgi:hypothetical protein
MWQALDLGAWHLSSWSTAGAQLMAALRNSRPMSDDMVPPLSAVPQCD